MRGGCGFDAIAIRLPGGHSILAAAGLFSQIFGRLEKEDCFTPARHRANSWIRAVRTLVPDEDAVIFAVELVEQWANAAD